MIINIPGIINSYGEFRDMYEKLNASDILELNIHVKKSIQPDLFYFEDSNTGYIRIHNNGLPIDYNCYVLSIYTKYNYPHRFHEILLKKILYNSTTKISYLNN